MTLNPIQVTNNHQELFEQIQDYATDDASKQFLKSLTLNEKAVIAYDDFLQISDMMLKDKNLVVLTPKFLSLFQEFVNEEFFLKLSENYNKFPTDNCIFAISGMIKTGQKLNGFFERLQEGEAPVYRIFSLLNYSGITAAQLVNAGFNPNREENGIPLLSIYINNMRAHKRETNTVYRYFRHLNDQDLKEKYGFLTRPESRLRKRQQLQDLETLLKTRTFAINATDRDGSTCLDYAMDAKLSRVVSLLKRYGALTGNEIIEAKQEDPSRQFYYRRKSPVSV